MHRNKKFAIYVTLLIIIFAIVINSNNKPKEYKLEIVAESDKLWTGVAVSQEDRIFTNFPRWRPDVSESVVEILPDGSLKPFPNNEWNDYNDSVDFANHFVCVQSVYVDAENFLWVLDPANPMFRGVIIGGAKLAKIDLETNLPVQMIIFDSTIVKPASYLNDVRIDTKKKIAYITDSGIGGLVVVDLKTESARRVLDNHFSTMAEDIVLTIEGKEWLFPGGVKPQIHSDGIALDNNGEYLYYQALTGRHMYRIKTEYLLDNSLSHYELGQKVENMGKTGASDGLWFTSDGDVLISALEESAVKMLCPDKKSKIMIQSNKLAWPDSFAEGSDGTIYVTTTQLNREITKLDPYRIWKLTEIK
jgi:sugar lactone lactonase YvrE